MTERIAIHPDQPQIAVIEHAAAVIRAGGLVAFPTETVYGLGADAFNAVAVKRIFMVKGRPAYDPVIVHIADVAELTRVAAHVPPVAYTLATHFWPGPLTLVLPKADAIPPVVTADGPTIAVRCPRHPVALALIRAAQRPIAAPSANRFGHTSPTTAEHVWHDLRQHVDLLLDGGPTAVGVESTVLDITKPTPVILRPGGVTVEALRAVLGEVVMHSGDSGAAPLASPGLLDRHYAPSTTLHLYTGTEPAIQAALVGIADDAAGVDVRLGLLVADEDLPLLADSPHVIAAVGPLTDLEQVAQRLFAALRTLDAANVELIVARDFPAVGLGVAIRDRLRRAADQTIHVG
jgi:L-threonylcarbamoyladenylate synthase